MTWKVDQVFCSLTISTNRLFCIKLICFVLLCWLFNNLRSKTLIFHVLSNSGIELQSSFIVFHFDLNNSILHRKSVLRQKLMKNGDKSEDVEQRTVTWCSLRSYNVSQIANDWGSTAVIKAVKKSWKIPIIKNCFGILYFIIEGFLSCFAFLYWNISGNHCTCRFATLFIQKDNTV